MKHLKLTFILVVTFHLVYGQENEQNFTNELMINVGTFTSIDVFEGFVDIVDDIVGTKKNNESSSPSISITYKHALKNNWRIYGEIAYQSSTNDLVSKSNNQKIGSAKNKYYSFGLGATYHYIQKPTFQMYSGGSIAISQQSETYSGSATLSDTNGQIFNFQLNALGFRFGKKIAAVLELGVGYKGIGALGISYLF